MFRTRGAPTQIVLADPQPDERDCIRRRLNREPDLEVVGLADDVAEALRQVRDRDPDVLVLDLAAPGDAVGLIDRLRTECPRTGVLVVTALDAPGHVLAVLASGGKGYVLKTAPAANLLAAVRAVARGSTYVKVTPAATADSTGPHDAEAHPPEDGGRRLVSPLL